MIKVKTEIPDAYEMVTRPVAMQVTKALLVALELPTSINIQFPGGAEEVPQLESTVGFRKDEGIFGSETKITLKVSEKTIEDQMLSNATYQEEHIPFFLDPAIDMRMWPIYVRKQMEFQFEMRFNSETLARRVEDEIKTSSSMLRSTLLHEFEYHYIIPKPLLNVLHHVYTLRETRGGYGDTYNEYCTAHLARNVTTLTDSAGSNHELAVRESQNTIIGNFGFRPIVDPAEKDKETGTYNLTFTYTISYDRPSGVGMAYPFIVHNQLVDPIYRAAPVVHGFGVDPYGGKLKKSNWRDAFDQISPLYNGDLIEPPKLVVIPEEDPWRPTYRQVDTIYLLQGALSVNDDDPRELIGLKDLGEYGLNDLLMPYAMETYSQLLRYAGSAIYVMIYENENIIDWRQLEIDSDLVIRSTFDLDVRKTYRIGVYVLSDLCSLSRSGQEVLRKHGQAAIAICNHLMLYTHGRMLDLELNRQGYLTQYDLERVCQFILDKKHPHNIANYGKFRTSGHYTIIAHRNRDLTNGTYSAQANGHPSAEYAAAVAAATGANGRTELHND